MAVLLEKVVFHFPDVIHAKPVSELALLKGVLDQLKLRVILPGSWQLMLVEDADLHAAVPSPSPSTGSSFERSSLAAPLASHVRSSVMTASPLV